MARSVPPYARPARDPKEKRVRSYRCAAALALTVCAHATAQHYPEKPVSLVVAFPAGGAVDLVARTLAQRMSELWAQPVLVINRAGAGGNIGAKAVARAAPDGYTLLIGSTALAIICRVFSKPAAPRSSPARGRAK